MPLEAARASLAPAKRAGVVFLPGSARGSRVLVVDDDADIVALLERYLSLQGFHVSSASDGAAMRESIARESVDLVPPDLGLPGEDALDLARYLRERWRGPVIIVTGRGDSVDRVVSLELGADDYVTKPFDLRELLARIRTVLRRVSERAAPATAANGEIFAFSGFRLDVRSRELRDAGGAVIALTTGEFALLELLVEHQHRVLSCDDLMSWMPRPRCGAVRSRDRRANRTPASQDRAGCGRVRADQVGARLGPFCLPHESRANDSPRGRRSLSLAVRDCPDAMIVVNREGRIVLANPQADSLFG